MRLYGSLFILAICALAACAFYDEGSSSITRNPPPDAGNHDCNGGVPDAAFLPDGGWIDDAAYLPDGGTYVPDAYIPDAPAPVDAGHGQH